MTGTAVSRCGAGNIAQEQTASSQTLQMQCQQASAKQQACHHHDGNVVDGNFTTGALYPWAEAVSVAMLLVEPSVWHNIPDEQVCCGLCDADWGMSCSKVLPTMCSTVGIYMSRLCTKIVQYIKVAVEGQA